jgi:hypothetical protein
LGAVETRARRHAESGENAVRAEVPESFAGFADSRVSRVSRIRMLREAAFRGLKLRAGLAVVWFGSA